MARERWGGRLLRRVLLIPVILWASVSLVFFAVQLLPGDPAQAAFAQSAATEQSIQARRTQLGLDDPIHVQYIRYVWGMLRGDLGTSWVVGLPVSSLVWRQFMFTLRLTAASMLFAILIGVLLGSIPSLLGALFAPFARGLSGLLLSTPVMFSGLLLLWLFSLRLNLLPPSGEGQVRHLILPMLVVGGSVGGTLAQSIDAGIVASRTAPFATAARSKGRSHMSVLVRHVFPVGVLPSLDVVALQTGFLLSGAIVTEALFNRQGLGSLMLNAVLTHDWPLLWGGVFLSAGVYALMLLLAEAIRSVISSR